MESLRVCHIIHDTHCGGTELTLYKVIRELHERHPCSVISLLEYGQVGTDLETLGVPVKALELTKNGRANPHHLFGALTWLRKWKPDVVQTWAYHSDLLGGICAKLSTSAPIIWNVRHATLDPVIDSRNTMRSAKLCGRISGWVPDRIILNSYAAMPPHQAVGYAREKMLVIPNGFDTSQFQRSPADRRAVRKELGIQENDLLLGMVGRFHPHKGHKLFIAAARELRQRNANLQFVIAGPECDEENEALVSWLTDAGLRQHTHLLGERSDVHRLLNAFDVHLMPSLTEGSPNVLGEAMACGIPVVATDVGDAGRMVGDSSCSYRQIVPKQDVAAMIEAVDSFLKMSAEQRLDVGLRNATHIAKDFALSSCANAYDRLWREVYAERQKRKRQRRNWWRGWLPFGKSQPTIEPMKNGLVEQSTSRRVPAHRNHDDQAGQPAIKRPRLVHVTTVPMTQYMFLRGQLEFMSSRGFDVHCVSSPGEYLDRLQARDPVTTHAIPISRRISCFDDGVSVCKLWKKFRQLEPDIVQVSTPKAAFLGALAAKFARVPIRIYQVRGLSSESERGLRRTAYQRLERMTARLCNGHLVNAKSLLKYAVDARILKSGLVAGQGMSNGVDLERFDRRLTTAMDLRAWDPDWSSESGPVIGFIGRLTRDKGLEELHYAWRQLRDEHPRARLLLVGPWEDENAVNQSVREQLLSDSQVILAGMQDDVARFYKQMDVFVYPSHGTEGFPNAPMEAAAMQLPVITTNVVGCVDAVQHGETGQIIEPRDGESLLQALRRYLNNPGLSSQHGEAGRERIRSAFVPSDLWSEFYDYYVHLLRREQRPLPVLTQPSRERRAA